MSWQRPRVPRLLARLTIPRSARLILGTISTEWCSLPSSLRLTLDGQSMPRRKDKPESTLEKQREEEEKQSYQ